ncbi:MAG: ion transporter [Nanoarchaeota archaeon]|nr:ion transporter [Nanoarchaeota archaeon]MBU1632843.1 ion transporter [Nanoarchaeota archaeon]MBU1876313.1 ion transporter [Nanoarchaeota archaeon]
MIKKKTVKKRSTSKRNLKKNNDEDTIDIKLMKEGAKFEDSIIGKIKKFLHLHVDNYASSHGRRIEGTLFLINLIAIIIFIIDSYNPIGIVKTILTISEFIVVGIFIIEYIIRMWIAPKKIKHFLNIYSLVDLISILPILTHFGNLYFFRLFRILRLFRMLRILRFQRIFKAKDTLFGKLTDTQLIITRIVLTIFTIIFVFSGLIWTVESRINPGYGTIWNAMYFSIVTLSTVGYGDVTPYSPLGKAITIIMILTGIALIPWQLGKLIKVVVVSASKIQIRCKRCGLENHDRDAIHCKNCGAILKKKKKLIEEED